MDNQYNEFRENLNKNIDKDKKKKISNSIYWFSILTLLLFFFYYAFQLFKNNNELVNNKIVTDSILNKYEQLVPLIEPEAYAEVLSFNKKTNRTNYNFTIYLKVQNEIINNIDSVHYFFDHPTFINNNEDYRLKTSSNRLDSFKVSYTGWGVINNVIITIFEKNSKTETINFNMVQNTQLKANIIN